MRVWAAGVYALCAVALFLVLPQAGGGAGHVSALAAAAEREAAKDDAVSFGTGQLASPHFSRKGQAEQWRDPDTGDVVTSVVPPRSSRDERDTFLLVAPQVYPDVPAMPGEVWGGGAHEGLRRPDLPGGAGQGLPGGRGHGAGPRPFLPPEAAGGMAR